MIDAMYNYRQGEIHSAEFSDEFNKLCIPFENSLNDEQIDVFHFVCKDFLSGFDLTHSFYRCIIKI